MKRFYTIALLIASPFIGFSQSVISNVAPNIGDQFEYNQSDYAPSPGPAGANQTWDFSNETITEYTGNYTVMTPDQVEGSENFPGATMVWVVNIEFGSLHSYMGFGNNAFTSYGMEASGEGFSSIITYSDPMVNFTYPLVYQNTGSDDYSGTMTGITGENNITGSKSFVVDGYGTVITPFGSYDDALRITTTSTETMVVFDIEMVTNSTETMWYAPDYPAPVMIILSSESYTAGILTDSSESTSALLSYTPATTGLAKRTNQNAFSIYPNPTSDQISVAFENAGAEAVLNIYSSTGKLVETKSGVQSDQKVDVSSLSPGIYIAVLHVDGQQYTQKPFSIVK